MYCITGLTLEPKCIDESTKVIVRSCVHLLRCISIGLGIHATGIPSSVANSLASHLLHVLSSSMEKG